jgi:hypothetical protein
MKLGFGFDCLTGIARVISEEVSAVSREGKTSGDAMAGSGAALSRGRENFEGNTPS